MTRRGPALPRRRLSRGESTGEELSEQDVTLTAMVSRRAANRQIAARLTWSEKTVERRLTLLFQRTGCRSRVEWPRPGLNGSLADRDPTVSRAGGSDLRYGVRAAGSAPGPTSRLRGARRCGRRWGDRAGRCPGSRRR